MPKATMKDQDEYPLPENTPFPAILESVSTRTIRYKDKETHEDKSFDKWEWVFQITEGEYAGLKAYGETEDRLTNHPDNKVRQWAETLLDFQFDVGYDLDTDHLIGLPCVVTVSNDPPREKRDGGKFYPCPVRDVFPEGTTGTEPPF